MARLSKRSVDALEARAAEFFAWCEELPGFGVRVWPSGAKIFVAQYRAGGRTRRFRIGRYGPLTVEEARKIARGILGEVARGEDPALDRATRRKSLSVRDLCDDYLEAARLGQILGKGGRPKKPSTIYTDAVRIERHIKPLLGAKLVIDLTTADINRFVRDVTIGKTAEKTAHGRTVGGRGAATRTVGLLGGILSFAVSEGIVPTNPARGIRRPAYTRRTRRLTAEEYRRLGEALTRGEADREREQGILGVWLLALTGCRLGEVVKLKWSEVDQAGSCFRLEDSKEGASVRPIGKAAFDMLARVRDNGSIYVLPAVRKQGAYGGLERAWKGIMARAGLEGVSPHTLRHSYASMAGDLGFADSTIAALLGHAAGSVTSRYVHHLDSVLIAAADKTARAVWSAMTGEAAKVVSLPTARR